MKAQDLYLTQLLQGAKQFIVPIFQRTYGWGTQHCEQLFTDILQVGSNDNQEAHFLGSVVYVADEDASASIPRWQVIDGQQRLTTLTLFLLAFCKEIDKRPETVADVSVEEIEDYYLKNRYGKEDLRYKMFLTQRDRKSLISLLEGRNLDGQVSESIKENYEYFCERLSDIDLNQAYTGFKKLMIVDVSLTRNQDDPQVIFESLNSTGMDLSQADLIRNFVLMRQSPDDQTRLFQEIWYPMEKQFSNLFGAEFDRFVRDYLTLRTKPPRPIRMGDVYYEFKRFFQERISHGESIDNILHDLGRLAKYYTRFALVKEDDADLKESFSYLRQLIEVASPLVMRLYEFYVAGNLNKADFNEAVKLTESYVFRRSVCDMQTRSLGQIFSTITYAIQEQNPLESLKVIFARFGKNRRFPTDYEFRESLLTRDIYGMRNCRFLLDRLENDSKEKIDTSGFTIEHVLPQNPILSPEWQAVLGDTWQSVHETYLHRLGNLTLTGYNERYSDAPFSKKKEMSGGFNESPLRLNKFLREQTTWNQNLIEERGCKLAEQALKLWGPLQIDDLIVKQYRLEERKSKASHLSLEDVEGLSGSVKELFEVLHERISALGEDVVKILAKKNVTYHVYEYFVQIIPRANRLTVVLNLDFEEVSDQSSFCRDASRRSFIMYASVKGGVYFQVWSDDDIERAMPYIRQAYEKASG